jgi:hypothetical protein
MTPPEMNKTCEQVAPLLVFYACGETEPDEAAFVEEHLANCAACRAQLSEEQSLQSMFGSLPQDADKLDVSGVLLSQCRSELAENLDDMVRPPVLEKTPVLGAFRRWMALRPVWSGTALVAVGLIVGVQASEWMISRNVVSPLEQAVDVRPGPHISDDQLSKMAVAGINFTPGAGSGSQNVRVQLNAEQPLELTGSIDNTDVRRVLTYVVKNGDRFDPGMRLDCLEALKVRSEDAVNLLVSSLEKPEVRGAEVVAMPGMTVAGDGNMMPTMMGHEASGSSLASVIRELETLQHNDSSQYVRMRSAAALRQLSARGDQ